MLLLHAMVVFIANETQKLASAPCSAQFLFLNWPDCFLEARSAQTAGVSGEVRALAMDVSMHTSLCALTKCSLAAASP